MCVNKNEFAFVPFEGAKARLNAHHIKKWADCHWLRYEVRNGITLCWTCHKRVTGSEELYEGLFMHIVSNNEQSK